MMQPWTGSLKKSGRSCVPGDRRLRIAGVDIAGTKLVVIGGAGLIGSHTVDRLLQEDVREVVIYDNFCRGTHDNLAGALKDPRVKIFEIGGGNWPRGKLCGGRQGGGGGFFL